MKTAEINASLAGKRVKGVFTGIEVTGTIIGIVEDLAFPWKPKSDENKVCSKGVLIKLDKPVQWGDYLYTKYVSTARVSDEFGNLKYTELIEVPLVMKMFNKVKEKHPDRLFLFRSGDFYEAYEEDARVCADILGITLVTRTDGNVKMAIFPFHSLDMHLPKLIASGRKVTIYDNPEHHAFYKQERHTIS